jgi:hypothetical protein
MADSLFDSRYRYDYIYPRGRSGETLRAVDTADNDRPVVIKRPAPNDAPPIRAGQEVSILNERKALTRLAGQATLTALLGGGQFVVGGTPHQYIVMERAEGEIVAEMVLELAARGERLPELEMLVMVDSLLGVLGAAHALDIVYNDVDAKHLFWDRDNYRLKLIDWGNAVFLEGDDITPQGVSRQSDIFQVGELLYFILSGGGRIEIPRDGGSDFRADFGYEASRVHSRLQAIISRAVHPNAKLRYSKIDDLRKDLAAYREPLERERNAILGRVTERLKRDRSKDELYSLLKVLEPALEMDPGYPAAREIQREISGRLNELEIAADLDAARIYLESGNWARATGLLEELRQHSRGETGILIALLLEWSRLLQDKDFRPAPPAVLDAIVLLFERHPARAAHLLLTQDDERVEARQVQWLLAERISAHLPEVLLLRPNLYRLDAALYYLNEEGVPVSEPRALLAEIRNTLDDVPEPQTVSLIALRDRYRKAVDSLTALGTLLEAVNSSYKLPNRKLPMSALERALNAAMALADNMHVIGKQATSSPRDALGALDSSRSIEPENPVWDYVAQMLDSLYETLEAYQIYVPSADGSDLELWLSTAQNELEPYTERLFDEMLVSIVKGLGVSEKSWRTFAAATIQGNRASAINALSQAIDGVSTVSPTLSGWLGQLRTIITNASYIERHALYGGLGRALADGWDAYDRGRLGDAERLGSQAMEIARNDAERFAARRLRELAEATRGWVERNGVSDAKRTQATLTQVELLYTSEENNTRNSFSAQMPTKETYLKAMGKGLVELYNRSSTAAIRLLFFNYLLLATLDAHDDALEDAAFWREAAMRTLPEIGPKHPAARALDDLADRRRDLQQAEDTLGRVNGPHALSSLENTRKSLEENPQARTLSPAIYSLRELEAAVRDWSDGEFRAAGIKLENALKALDDVESQAAISVTNYRAWLMDLISAAADLHTSSRTMLQVIETRPDEPRENVRATHHRLVDVTTRLLGQSYAANLRSWRDTYEAFLAAYSDRTMRRSARLARFNELFRAMFIDRHPAYPLYRHWYEQTEHAPEFPAPPTDEPTPRLTEEEPPPTLSEAPHAPDLLPQEPLDDAPPVERRRERRRSGSRLPLIAGILLLLVVAAGVIVAANGGLPGQTPTAAPTQTVAAGVAVVMATDEATEPPTDEATPTSGSGFIMFTPAPGSEATEAPTISRALPTRTPAPTDPPATSDFPAIAPTEPTVAPTTAPTSTPDLPTPTQTFTPAPTDTPTPVPTARPTLPPGGLTGKQDLLMAASGAGDDVPWTAAQFAQPSPDAVWRLGVADAEGDGTGDVVVVPMPPDVLETFFGNDASQRIRAVEATLALTTFEQSLMSEQQVFFGTVLASAADPQQTIGVQVQVNQPGIINLGQREGSIVRMISQRSVAAMVVNIRLTRDPVTGVVTTYYNGEQLGQPVLFVPPEEPVVPVLFVRNGGIIVSVSEWTVTLE